MPTLKEIIAGYSMFEKGEQVKILLALSEEFLKESGISQVTTAIGKHGPIQYFTISDPEKLAANFPEYRDIIQSGLEQLKDPNLLRDATPFTRIDED